MPDIESHSVIIINKATEMKNRGNQILQLAEEVHTRAHNNQFSQAEQAALETEFDGLESDLGTVEGAYAALDEHVGEIEQILGI